MNNAILKSVIFVLAKCGGLVKLTKWWECMKSRCEDDANTSNVATQCDSINLREKIGIFSEELANNKISPLRLYEYNS